MQNNKILAFKAEKKPETAEDMLNHFINSLVAVDQMELNPESTVTVYQEEAKEIILEIQAEFIDEMNSVYDFLRERGEIEVQDIPMVINALLWWRDREFGKKNDSNKKEESD